MLIMYIFLSNVFNNLSYESFIDNEPYPNSLEYVALLVSVYFISEPEVVLLFMSFNSIWYAFIWISEFFSKSEMVILAKE